MTALPLDDVWKLRLDLDGRQPPELYERVEDVWNSPHAGAIRATLEGLGASAVFCVQGVPTIVLLHVDQYDRSEIVSLHAALWNQGLASVLLVISDQTIRSFSLARKPYREADDEFDQRCLVETLNVTTDALALKNLVYAAESGRLWEEHADYFRPKERVDQVLLENLTCAHTLLCEAGLSSDAAQALLIQAMFIAYLEDREIIGEDYFKGASNGRVATFSALLETASVTILKQLFSTLRQDFNGDLFVAPCSFEPGASPPRFGRLHFEVLARFRAGREEMGGSGQLRFWGYDFKHIPIELISAVYDRFLGEREAERREHGAYYTPMFLADTVVSQIWDTLPLTTKEKGDFLDPACGSGVFLVRSFQRICEHWRETRRSRAIRWGSLRNILCRLHGWDLNSGAVRVAVFSLYIALLEQVSPPDIRLLLKRGKVLPELWGHTLKRQDFFSADPTGAQFDVVIGNPPWTSRRGPTRTSIKWCEGENLPMPNREDAWAFTWKSLRHLRADGLIAFLLPAMGFLHNHSDISIEARNRLISMARIRRIVNFADLRFQLFDGAIRPAALIVLGAAAPDAPAYRFEYCAPKADLNLKIKRLITLSSADKSFITSETATNDPLVFKHRLWMSEPDSKLFNYLGALPKLGHLVREFGSHRHDDTMGRNQWLIGQGFQPSYSTSSGSFKISSHVSRIPYLPIANFQPLAQPTQGLSPWHSSRVRRKGFERGFEGPRILAPRGVNVANMRLRATYLETPLVFQDIIQAIVVPPGEERRAKLLTALLNSKVAIWYAFHGTASFGSERPEVKQAELMRLPFPDACDLPEPEKASEAAKKLISIVDEALLSVSTDFTLQKDSDATFANLDQAAYEYFCLSAKEVILIEDAIEYIFPAVQPHSGSYPAIWKPPGAAERRSYADMLVQTLKEWSKDEHAINVGIEAYNDDLAVLRLTLSQYASTAPYTERNDSGVRSVLARLFSNIHQRLPGNFQLVPDLRLFANNNLYLVKPMQRRFWLRSAALADASAIALDLHDYVSSPKKQGHA